MPNSRPDLPAEAAAMPDLPSRRLLALPQTIVDLCSDFEREELDRATFLEDCTRKVCAAIGCSRVGIWVFVQTAAGLLLRCVAMYDGRADRMVRAADETHDVETYFRALEQPGYVVAHDARSHTATTGFFADRLEARGVHSLLAASLSVNGAVYGAFTCTQVDRPTQWSPAQLSALRQAAARASLSLFRRSRFTPSTGVGSLVD